MKIFNPDGNDTKQNRELFTGNSTNIINLNDIKYDWAVRLYSQMRDNFWRPEKTDLTQDKTDYNNLTSGEKNAYDSILSFLVFLDSIQVCNLPYIATEFTAPEARLCVAEQISQEGMHGHAYGYGIESIIPEKEQRNKIYDKWRDDLILKERCDYIASTFQDFIDMKDKSSYGKALIADYVLEGLYFYQGFVFFYSLAHRSLMGGTADLIKLIHRDELSHVRLYQELIKEAINVFKIPKDWIYEFFYGAGEKEIEWNQHIMNNEILGITDSSIEEYTKYLIDLRLKAIGLKPIFKGEDNKNPYKHLDKIANTSNEATTKENFFDVNVTSYVGSSSIAGWEDV